VLSTAALVTSFASGVGLYGLDPTKGRSCQHGVRAPIGALSMALLWPAKDWAFGPDAGLILTKMDEGQDIDKTAGISRSRG
jgi:hypothetical protein